jgi:hypothetical protein
VRLVEILFIGCTLSTCILLTLSTNSTIAHLSRKQTTIVLFHHFHKSNLQFLSPAYKTNLATNLPIYENASSPPQHTVRKTNLESRDYLCVAALLTSRAVQSSVFSHAT